jgi:hypothetical protein
VLLEFLVGSAGRDLLAAGRTDRLKGAPFYKTYSKKISGDNRSVVHLGIGFDEEMRSEFFYAGRENALQPLADAMTAYLDSLQWSTRIDSPALPEKGAPYTYVGSSEGETAPPGAEMQREEFDKYPPMIIYIQKPSKEWKSSLAQLLVREEKEYLLFISIGFSEYPKANKRAFEKKVVLGTGYQEGVKFLSAEDKPVEVLQVTGMLLDREGNILRAGAEGILHKDTPFSLQIFDIQKSIDDAAIRKLLTQERREDLPGKPLKWKTAIHNLISQLLPQKQSTIQ